MPQVINCSRIVDDFRASGAVGRQFPELVMRVARQVSDQIVTDGEPRLPSGNLINIVGLAIAGSIIQDRADDLLERISIRRSKLRALEGISPAVLEEAESAKLGPGDVTTHVVNQTAALVTEQLGGPRATGHRFGAVNYLAAERTPHVITRAAMHLMRGINGNLDDLQRAIGEDCLHLELARDLGSARRYEIVEAVTNRARSRLNDIETDRRGQTHHDALVEFLARRLAERSLEGLTTALCDALDVEPLALRGETTRALIAFQAEPPVAA